LRNPFIPEILPARGLTKGSITGSLLSDNDIFISGLELDESREHFPPERNDEKSQCPSLLTLQCLIEGKNRLKFSK